MFWDSSALVPLLVAEPRTAQIGALAKEERRAVIWWATPVECQTAIARRHRESRLPAGLRNEASARITRLTQDAGVVAATDAVRERARRLVTTHPLRSADALQLAAALVWCEEQPTGEGFVSLDNRLREAAEREGFTVLPAAAAIRSR